MKRQIQIWLIASLLIAGFLSLFASSHPDGYEKAGEELGFIDQGTSFFSAPIPDYALGGSESWVSSSLAGIIGVLITFGVFYLVGKVTGKNNR